jgi:hypothetical protein
VDQQVYQWNGQVKAVFTFSQPSRAGQDQINGVAQEHLSQAAQEMLNTWNTSPLPQKFVFHAITLDGILGFWVETHTLPDGTGEWSCGGTAVGTLYYTLQSPTHPEFRSLTHKEVPPRSKRKFVGATSGGNIVEKETSMATGEQFDGVFIGGQAEKVGDGYFLHVTQPAFGAYAHLIITGVSLEIGDAIVAHWEGGKAVKIVYIFSYLSNQFSPHAAGAYVSHILL